jgi:hypothetical protein
MPTQEGRRENEECRKQAKAKPSQSHARENAEGRMKNAE